MSSPTPTTTKTVVPSPMQYLDRATGVLRDLGLMPSKIDEQPIIALLQKISDLDQDRVAVIARTLNQVGVFNEVVRNQVAGMEVGERYDLITKSFNSIRDDAKRMVDQLADGKLSTFERIENVWTKVRRGDIATRFDSIRVTYLDVARATKDQIQREVTILDAYRDFRGAMKQAEVMALEVLEKANAKLQAKQEELKASSEAVSAYTGTVPAERANLELVRDTKLREMQDEEKRFQISKDLSDNLTIGYNTSEVIMARLMQTTNAKERVYAQAISFFSTNDAVLTALKASFTGLQGLHESTKTLNEMKEGVSKSLETLSEIGDKVQEAALRAGYGPTIRADAVKKLVESVVTFQEKSGEIILEMRKLSTKNSQEIRDVVEDGKRRLAALAEKGAALGM
ncbi:cell surface protein [Phreatobacter aquaticus]|uniref:Cell surface protein n=1 Tax=Phreatobacter aquaticus TaxID=2570229 RepID=A0A4D7QBI9_9HYPH|nr:cell surface protein [Phreatobacter aquaticus]QCK85410.1 cell surface protein [Phreatobacter aquaticus]